MKLLKAQNILWPEYYKEYNIKQLENFYNYERLERNNRRTTSQKFRLDCLMKDMDEKGLLYPIIVSWVGYRVSVGHQRVWYAYKNGYTHISCYHVPNQRVWDRIMQSQYSDEYWETRKMSELILECKERNRKFLERKGFTIEKIPLKKIECIDANTPREDKKAMNAILVQSIPKEGMLWPIIVRKKDDPMWQRHRIRMVKDEAEYIVWYGNNRYRYAERNKYDSIDCIICANSNTERDQLCEYMGIPRREDPHNEWLERGRSIVNTEDLSTA